MSKITYKEFEYNEEAILNLYLNNEWYLYTQKKEQLFLGIKNSLYTYAAYEKNLLVGLVRVVGDGKTIVYIQDILVLREYQNHGIGSVLLKHIFNKYQDVRQIVLTTDKTEQQMKFYKKNGLKDYNDLGLTGFKKTK